MSGFDKKPEVSPDEILRLPGARRNRKKKFVAEFDSGSTIDDIFFLREVEEKNTRDGHSYLALRLSDKSGVMDARVWERVRELKAQLRPDSFVHVRGTIERYRGRLQARVQGAQAVDSNGLDQRDFLPSTYRSTEELTDFLRYFLTEVFDEDYAALLDSFFRDEAFMERFTLAPGHLCSHHAYLGGLLEHTVAVTTLCQYTAVQHQRLNSDLLITAALLHDIGKTAEFCYEGRISLSREGKLLGHVILGQRMIEKQLRESFPDFPPEKELKLIHAIISHHGELEWGAPRRPQSAEALVLHHIDNLDARVKGFFEVVAGKGELSWTEMKNYFRRPLTEPMAADREPDEGGLK